MLDPNGPEQTTQPRKLVLPASPGDQNRPNDQTQYVRPEQLIRPTSTPPPGKPMAKLKYFWSKDPAYKVLIIAVATVVVSGLIFSILGSISLLQNSNSASQDNSTPQNPPTATSPGNPTFPTPGGTSVSTASSQPPKKGVVTVTPDVQSTPVTSPGQGGSLGVQILYIPTVVENNSRTVVDVSTNQTFATVVLQVKYNAFPFNYTSQPVPTDGNGEANPVWRVHVRGNGSGTVAATVVAIVTDQNGQQSASAPANVIIYTAG
jgi:hypothetical protein